MYVPAGSAKAAEPEKTACVKVKVPLASNYGPFGVLWGVIWSESLNLCALK